MSTPPESSIFYLNALRVVALSSAVSRSLNELAVKVVAANMVRTGRSLSGTHLLCAVGRYQDACSHVVFYCRKLFFLAKCLFFPFCIITIMMVFLLHWYKLMVQ
ncbi:putative WD repeat-containing protein [Helianthus annuus]|nr:putative WD repeat-containing protein [Helianthus annuus]